MAYKDANFIRLLNAASAPQFIIESTHIDAEPYSERVQWSSFHTGAGHQAILTPGFQINSGQLQPMTWDASTGSFAFGILRASFRPESITRGQVLALLVGYPGLPWAQFERVAVGRIWSATAIGAEVRITCRDLLALGSRFATATNKTGLFGSLTGDVVDSAFTKNSSNRLTVVSTSGFQYSETGAGAIDGALLCTPTAGDAFYLRYTAAPSATVFNSVSTLDVWNTTQITLESPNPVLEVAMIEDHPANIALRILSSSGNPGQNGAYDDLPETWGFDIGDAYLDISDVQHQVTRTQPASGSALWTVLETTEQTNPGDWLRAFLAPGGWFLAMRQGSITCRSVPRLDSPQLRIDDVDIVAIRSQDFWSQDYDVEYQRISILAKDGTQQGTSEAVQTNPAQAVSEHTIPVYTNESAQCAEVVGRLKLYELRIPERLVLTLIGARGDLAIGEEILLTTRLGTDRRGRALTERPCVLLSIDVDWWAGVSEAVLMIPADSATEI